MKVLNVKAQLSYAYNRSTGEISNRFGSVFLTKTQAAFFEIIVDYHRDNPLPLEELYEKVYPLKINKPMPEATYTNLCLFRAKLRKINIDVINIHSRGYYLKFPGEK